MVYEKLTILIIDDNVDFIELVKFILQDTNWQVLTALNGKDGIELAKKYEPEIVLLDLVMPIMDGIEVYQILKSNFKTRSSTIIFLTTMPRKHSRIEVLLKDVEVVEKPLNIMLLIDRISQIYNKSQQCDRKVTFEYK